MVSDSNIMSSANNSITNWTKSLLRLIPCLPLTLLIISRASSLINSENKTGLHTSPFHSTGTVDIVCKLSTTSNSSLHIFIHTSNTLIVYP